MRLGHHNGIQRYGWLRIAAPASLEPSGLVAATVESAVRSVQTAFGSVSLHTELYYYFLKDTETNYAGTPRKGTAAVEDITSRPNTNAGQTTTTRESKIHIVNFLRGQTDGACLPRETHQLHSRQ